jgi:hypothetical protein
MESANNLLAKLPLTERSAMPGSTSPRWTPETEKLVALLWVRMTQMFPSKWSSGAGAFRAMGGGLTETAKTWCWKLDGLTERQFAAGIRELEYRSQQAGALGKELWPPSYSEFRGMALNPSGAGWEHRQIEQADRDRAAQLALGYQDTIEARRAAGRSELDKMRSMLGLEVHAA